MQENRELLIYKRKINRRIRELKDILARIIIGDFTVTIPIPKVDDELTDIYVGMHYMLEVVKEKISELEKKQKDLNDAQSLAQIGSFEFNLESKELTLSDELYEILGWQKKSIKPGLESIIQTADSGYIDMIQQKLKNTIRRSSPLFSEHIINRSDREKIWVRLTGKMTRNRKGKPTVLIGTLQNITTQKEVDRAKSEFLSIVAHQIRTPLSTMKWYSSMLLDQKQGKLTQKQNKYLRYIYEASVRMATLISSLLNVSRIELGKISVDIKDIEVKEIFSDVVEEFQSEIQTKQLEINQNYSKKTPLIKADRKLLNIVIQNLVSNAVHYTPKNGSIKLTTVPYKGKVLLTVKDSGYGIAPADQTKIFTKLFRAEHTKKKVPEGTGLGLYVTKSIVEKIFGGKVWFESLLNKGTTFYVLLPLKQAKDRDLINKLI